jgi:hypothetical protein
MSKVKTFLQKWQGVLLIIVVSILAYGLLIPWLGYYTDDWTFTWAYKLYGSQGLFNYFSLNRPFFGLTFQLTMPILQDNILAWQIFGLICRIITSLSFYWLTCLIWPKQKRLTLCAGLLFAVYPGFLLQPIALCFGHIWLVYTSFLISNCFTILAFRNPSKKAAYTIAAVLLSLYNMLSMEYFFSLEVLRWLLLFYLITEPLPFWRKIGKSIQLWVPYLIALIGVGIYRGFFYKGQTYKFPLKLFDVLKHNFGAGLLLLGKEIVSAIYQSTVFAWIQPIFEFGSRAAKNRTYFVIAAFMVIVLVGLFLVLRRAYRSVDSEVASGRDTSPLVIAIAGLLLAGIPFYVTELNVQAADFSSRFTMPFMVGSALLLAFLIDLIPFRWLKVGLLSLLLTGSIGLNLFNANDYRLMQVQNNELMYEMWWRAPSLEPGTLVVTTEKTNSWFYTYSTMQSELNLIYPHDTAFSYGWIFSRDLASMLPKPVDANTRIQIPIIVGDISGKINQIVVFQIGDEGCVRFIDASSGIISQDISNYSFQNFSNPANLLSNPNQPVKLNASLVGPEPAHGWCYYFEKSDLALQQKNYVTIQENYQTVAKKSLKPRYGYEWAPYIEGLARAGDWQNSLQIARQVIAENPPKVGDQPADEYKPFVCQIFKRLTDESDLAKQAEVALVTLNCSH